MVHGSAISSDGINWKTSSSRLSQIGFANGTFFATAIGIMKIVSSTDGETWANTGIDYGGLNFQSIVYGAGKYVTFTNRYSTNPATTGL